jgi:hypothetical protein
MSSWDQSKAITADLYYSEEMIGSAFGKSAIRNARKTGCIQFVRANGCFAYKGRWVIEWLERVSLQKANLAMLEQGALTTEDAVLTQLTNNKVCEATTNG